MARGSGPDPVAWAHRALAQLDPPPTPTACRLAIQENEGLPFALKGSRKVQIRATLSTGGRLVWLVARSALLLSIRPGHSNMFLLFVFGHWARE
jgi:hypothetical protein